MSGALIRSVFDQYAHVENRLTHGLLQVLAGDQRLAREFASFATATVRPKRRKLSFACQMTPGDAPRILDDEQLAEQRGVPDAWIFEEAGGWALLIESKVGAALTPDQLRRHISTARRRGFSTDPGGALLSDIELIIERT